MTNQELYDKVVKHLRKQGKKAWHDGEETCMYRWREGTKVLKCAAGCLIAKKHYKSSLEGFLVTDMNVKRALVSSGVIQANDSITIELLRQLQRVHDAYDVSKWEKRLKQVAKDNGLKYSKP